MTTGLRIAVLYEPAQGIAQKAARRPRPRPRPAKGPRRKKEKAPQPRLDRDEVFDALTALGHQPLFYELTDEAQLLGLARRPADLIFNLTEAYAGDDSKDWHIAAFLDLLQIRYTGSGPRGLFLGQDKPLAKKIISFHGIETPAFALADGGAVQLEKEMSFPLIVKPSTEDGSVGIDAGSVVHDEDEMCKRVRWVHEEFGCEALVEQYVEGRELYVGVLGNGPGAVALPPVELDLSRLPEGVPRIATEEVKWGVGSEAYRVTTIGIARDLDAATAERLRHCALTSYHALRLRDYARVDLRLSPDGQVHVIEANPNPWLGSGAEFAMAAGEAGISYTELIGRIVDLSLTR